MNVNIRAYGWYCNHCKYIPSINNISVCKLFYSNKVFVICDICSHTLYNCQDIDWKGKDCSKCEYRFDCLVDSQRTVEKPLSKVSPSKLVLSEPVKPKTKGVLLYTGLTVHKLAPDNVCIFPQRDDCNYSEARMAYDGKPYNRCMYMKYETKDKKWVCLLNE